MACPNRLPGVSRASAIRRLPEACAARRRADVLGMRRRANTLHDAGRGAWPGAAEDDACASEGKS
ncbi:hypothetical protein D5R55_30625 [Burkholderia cenocepacia]|uniref:Uncharacterized protein n=1 Tax=Burkholderia cenocepacia TaxID=95486 RepID=A0A3Q9FEG8_9BURK|nr:hypothetical protein D5R55_30625 [Burkholderia cenocepacia]